MMAMRWNMGLEERARLRKMRMAVHRAVSFDDAELWDLEYWQSVTPKERLLAYMAIRREVALVQASRKSDDAKQEALFGVPESLKGGRRHLSSNKPANEIDSQTSPSPLRRSHLSAAGFTTRGGK
jgi:hypothetical protein